MGVITGLRAKRVYVDTNILIYLLEGTQQKAELIGELKKALQERQFAAVISPLIITEILPPLVKQDDRERIDGTLEFLLSAGIFEVAELSQEVCVQAGVLRGELGMKTPDALHVATALAANCSVFLTADKGIRVPPPMKVVLV